LGWLITHPTMRAITTSATVIATATGKTLICNFPAADGIAVSKRSCVGLIDGAQKGFRRLKHRNCFEDQNTSNLLEKSAKRLWYWHQYD
jgi:hypothetical protein